MKDWVIDASVLVKLFFEEEHSETATRLVEQANSLIAPDLIWPESTNVTWKRQRRNQISEQTAVCIASGMLQVPVQSYSSAELVLDALTVAVHYGQTVYDGLYVALAVRTGLQLLTGDRHLVDALRNSPFETHVRWLGDGR